MTSFHIRTFGCSHNFADSEQMAGLLKEAKFELADNIENADLVIFNTCTVKSPAEANFFKELEDMKKEYPYKIIIIAGCIPQTDPEKLQDYCLIGTRQIHHVVEIAEEALNNNIIKMLETGEMPPLNLPKVRKNPIVEIIPINRGCLSACTFCKTKSARGNLQSYPIVDIVASAEKGIAEGIKEIWLTSQDTLCYGFDLGTNLPNLIKELIRLPGNFKIRIGMGNPVHLTKIKDELFPLLNHKKVFQFLHLPAQSGSDKILADMKRGNTAKEFISMVNEAREIVPRLTVTTDIIVGFPGETDDDYWQTLELIKQTSPDNINVSKFWKRPKTPAAKLKEMPSEMMKHRSTVLMNIAQNISKLQNERWIGWEGEILIDEKGKLDHQWIGRNSSYRQILVEGNYKLGDLIAVRITKANIYDVRGEII